LFFYNYIIYLHELSINKYMNDIYIYIYNIFVIIINETINFEKNLNHYFIFQGKNNTIIFI
jgi:hypothetical protein